MKSISKTDPREIIASANCSIYLGGPKVDCSRGVRQCRGALHEFYAPSQRGDLLKSLCQGLDSLENKSRGALRKVPAPGQEGRALPGVQLLGRHVLGPVRAPRDAQPVRVQLLQPNVPPGKHQVLVPQALNDCGDLLCPQI